MQNDTQALQPESATVAAVRSHISIMSIIAWIWLCGMILMLLGLCWLYEANYKKFKTIHYIDDPFINGFIAKQKMKQKVIVGTLPNIHSPAVSGVFHPIIALTADYNAFSKEELGYILTHEFQHIKKRDNL